MKNNVNSSKRTSKREKRNSNPISLDDIKEFQMLPSRATLGSKIKKRKKDKGKKWAEVYELLF